MKINQSLFEIIFAAASIACAVLICMVVISYRSTKHLNAEVAKRSNFITQIDSHIEYVSNQVPRVVSNTAPDK